MLAYLHPAIAVLVLAFLAHVASLGVRARNERRHRAAYLKRHAKLAPWLYAMVVLIWLGGFASTWALRPYEELATSGHFVIGVLLVVVLSAGALSSRWMDRPVVRAMHPWLGAAALLLSAAQVFFGLQILP